MWAAKVLTIGWSTGCKLHQPSYPLPTPSPSPDAGAPTGYGAIHRNAGLLQPQLVRMLLNTRCLSPKSCLNQEHLCEHRHRSTGLGDLIGTSAFGPNLNIIRE